MATATATAAASSTAFCHWRFTPKSGNVPATNGLSLRAVDTLQMRVPAASMITSRPRVTMIGRSAEAP